MKTQLEEFDLVILRGGSFVALLRPEPNLLIAVDWHPPLTC